MLLSRVDILDCGLIANEVVEEYRFYKKEGWVLKSDFEKAYDNVDWGFLDFVLMKKRFWGSLEKVD